VIEKTRFLGFGPSAIALSIPKKRSRLPSRTNDTTSPSPSKHRPSPFPKNSRPSSSSKRGIAENPLDLKYHYVLRSAIIILMSSFRKVLCQKLHDFRELSSKFSLGSTHRLIFTQFMVSIMLCSVLSL
jgi:hypothetical protein